MNYKYNYNYNNYNYDKRHGSGYSSPMQTQVYYPYNTGDERLVGGFLGPFVLGGLTGGLVAPYFYNNNNNRPTYYYPGPYYYPYRPY